MLAGTTSTGALTTVAEPSRSAVFCGSRKWIDYPAIRDRMRELDPEVTVIHGGAPGADFWAGMAAAFAKRPVREFKADWKTHGKAAGPIRNRKMLDEGPELVIAFQIGKSRGTQDTIDEARRRGIPVEVHHA